MTEIKGNYFTEISNIFDTSRKCTEVMLFSY